MAEFESILSELLSSPEAMAQVMNIAKAVAGEPEKPVSPTNAAEPINEVQEHKVSQSIPMLSKLDPRFISSAMSVFNEYTKEDNGIKLMQSLKTQLGEESSARIDRAINALRVSRSVRTALHALKGEK